jgi:glutamyl-tRNA synthetase/glutamyl-Q tRNA(Asp) synthetase
VIVTRFAPAPTGYLHLGHIVNAVYVWGLARAAGGRVLVRIEDHDRQRSRIDYERAMLEDLEWLGFTWDQPLVRQSGRTALYTAALDSLRTRGLIYPCECSRRDIESVAEAGIEELRYPGTCSGKALPERAGLGIRLRLGTDVERFDDAMRGGLEQLPFNQCGDLLLRDREGNWTYQFAVTVDDWLQGITVVVRGEDLLSSTGRQLQLARLLGRRTPPIFLHHPLVMKSPSQKLSKSDGDTGVRDLRARGWQAADVVGEAVRLAGFETASHAVTVGDLSALPGITALAARVSALSAAMA